jgi:hypothetical protein
VDPPQTVARANATSSPALPDDVNRSIRVCPNRSIDRPQTGVPTADPMANAPVTKPATL